MPKKEDKKKDDKEDKESWEEAALKTIPKAAVVSVIKFADAKHKPIREMYTAQDFTSTHARPSREVDADVYRLSYPMKEKESDKKDPLKGVPFLKVFDFCRIKGMNESQCQTEACKETCTITGAVALRWQDSCALFVPLSVAIFHLSNVKELRSAKKKSLVRSLWLVFLRANGFNATEAAALIAVNAKAPKKTTVITNDKKKEVKKKPAPKPPKNGNTEKDKKPVKRKREPTEEEIKATKDQEQKKARTRFLQEPDIQALSVKHRERQDDADDRKKKKKVEKTEEDGDDADDESDDTWDELAKEGAEELDRHQASVKKQKPSIDDD